MGDLLFVAVVVAFFAVTLAYVKGCERIVGPDTPLPDEGRRGRRTERCRDAPRRQPGPGARPDGRRQRHRPRAGRGCWSAYLVVALVFPEKL